ncbi:MAG: sulfotransferase domain-containing protein [Leptospirales bacterium]
MKKDDRKVPNFLGIGAQKAASTWLYELLKLHPDIWMPLIKEIHYFDRSKKYKTPSRCSAIGYDERFFQDNGFSSAMLQLLRKQFRNNYQKKNWENLFWLCHFTFGTFDDVWYKNLFSGSGGQICGEITPSYSIIDSEDVAKVAFMNPQMKIIFLLRNPIDRAWSVCQYNTLKKRGQFASDISIKSMIDFFKSPGQVLRGDYLRTYRNWSRHFPESNIFIGFYDEVRDDPVRLINRVTQFLGIGDYPVEYLGKTKEKVNFSKTMQMPDEIRRYLTQMYAEPIRKMADKFGSYAIQWANQIP